MTPHASFALVLVACSALTGCEAPAELAATFQQSDSAGVTIAFSPGPRQASGVIRVDSVPRLTFSESPGSVDVLLDVRAAGRLGDGRIVVLNGKPRELLLIDREGRVVRRIGRAGGGPGEFDTPVSLRVSGDSVAIWGAMFGPRNVYDSTGTVLSTRVFDLGLIHRALGTGLSSEMLVPFGMSGVLIPAALTDRTRVISDSSGGERPEGRLVMLDDATLTRRWTIDHPGSVSYLVTVGGRTVRAMPFVFVRSIAAVDEASGTILVGDGTTPRVDRYDEEGTLISSIRWAADLRQATPDEYEAMEAIWLGNTRTMTGIPDAGPLLKSLPDQRRFAPVLGIVPDANGGFWVRAGIREWDVFGPDGEWLTQVELPFRTLFAIGHDVVLGLELDDDGVESISEYRISRE